MIDPIQRFEEEHQHALGELQKLEDAARALAAGAESDVKDDQLEAARAAHQFLTTAVREHNENEELALFSVLGDELSAIDARNPTWIAAAGLAIVDVLRDHIDREDNALFPMARELLGPEGLLEVARRLES
jgi:hemerythrin-like domain-containing protein